MKIHDAYDIGKLYGLIIELRSKRLNQNISVHPNRLIDLRENIDILAQGLHADELVIYQDEFLGDHAPKLSLEEEQENQRNTKLILESNYNDLIDVIRNYYSSEDSETLIENLFAIYEVEVEKIQY